MTDRSDWAGDGGPRGSFSPDWFGQWWVEAWKVGAQSCAPAEPYRSAWSTDDIVLSAPTQALWIGFLAWLRCSGAMFEAFGQYEAALVQVARNPGRGGSGLTPTENRALVDETRLLLRRIGEAGSFEARRAQHELERLGERIAQAAAAGEDASAPPGERIRRHEAKG